MPELPEVETLCRQLSGIIIGEKILEVKIFDAKLGALPELEERTVCFVARLGKSINIKLDDSRTIRIHLRMTGKLFWQNDAASSVTPDYSRLIIVFSNGRLDLIDPRRFATFQVADTFTTDQLSVNPLVDFDAKRLQKMAASRKIPIKSFLMDQRFIAGIGNIYACEILHEAGIDPAKKVADVSVAQWKRIAKATVPILQEAVICRGTTVSDWRDLFGRPGEYQHRLKIYAKKGLECSRCRCVVERINQGGRGTYYCPSCQKG